MRKPTWVSLVDRFRSKQKSRHGCCKGQYQASQTLCENNCDLDVKTKQTTVDKWRRRKRVLRPMLQKIRADACVRPWMPRTLQKWTKRGNQVECFLRTLRSTAKECARSMALPQDTFFVSSNQNSGAEARSTQILCGTCSTSSHEKDDQNYYPETQ